MEAKHYLIIWMAVLTLWMLSHEVLDAHRWKIMDARVTNVEFSAQ